MVADLIRDRAFIGGEWVLSSTGRNFSVSDPATGQEIGVVADCGVAETTRAIETAAAAFDAWRGQSAAERAGCLQAWAGLIAESAESLARLLTQEQGKPLAEARTEIKAAIESIVWSAEEGRRVCGQTIPAFKQGTKVLTFLEPVGVCAAITPWNFPVSMVTRKLAPALAAGCTVVLKPAEDTPLSALALAVLAEKAGIPAGVFNVVTCSLEQVSAVGQLLCTHELVRKISFTGSTDVGRLLMRQAADGLKRITLELGGNAPFIVFDSADLDRAVQGAVLSKFRNAGQTCICANRIFVQSGLYDRFVARLSEVVGRLTVGAGLDSGVEVGPLINREAVAKACLHVEDAVKKGARLMVGGACAGEGLFFSPTVLADMTPDMRLFQEETFGPIAGIFRFDTEDEVLSLANSTPYGLAAYFYTADLAQFWRVSAQLDYGMVAVNEPFLSSATIPFGGRKESGFGREGGPDGLRDFLDTKYVLVG